MVTLCHLTALQPARITINTISRQNNFEKSQRVYLKRLNEIQRHWTKYIIHNTALLGQACKEVDPCYFAVITPPFTLWWQWLAGVKDNQICEKNDLIVIDGILTVCLIVVRCNQIMLVSYKFFNLFLVLLTAFLA